jgi:hypothetical protein
VFKRVVAKRRTRFARAEIAIQVGAVGYAAATAFRRCECLGERAKCARLLLTGPNCDRKTGADATFGVSPQGSEAVRATPDGRDSSRT